MYIRSSKRKMEIDTDEITSVDIPTVEYIDELNRMTELRYIKSAIDRCFDLDSQGTGSNTIKIVFEDSRTSLHPENMKLFEELGYDIDISATNDNSYSILCLSWKVDDEPLAEDEPETINDADDNNDDSTSVDE